MAQPSTPFAIALARHDQRVLRDAFEACNESGQASYNRTTLTRWLDRSVPRDGEFVECLAERLNDPSLLETWHQARKVGAGAGGDSVVERFARLSESERADAFQKIRQVYLSKYPSVRSRHTIRVDLYDSEVEEADLFDLRVVLRWNGRLPENANVSYVARQQGLGDKFEESACIFREALNLDQSTFDQLLESSSFEQILSYRPLDIGNPVVTSFEGKPAAPGVFEFGNEEVEGVAVRLDVRYPYPKRPQTLPFRFGQYQVTGLVEVTFALHSPAVSDPQGMPFLPPGQERIWSSDSLPRNELVMYLGNDETLLSEGDGVVLSWS